VRRRSKLEKMKQCLRLLASDFMQLLFAAKPGVVLSWNETVFAIAAVLCFMMLFFFLSMI